MIFSKRDFFFSDFPSVIKNQHNTLLLTEGVKVETAENLLFYLKDKAKFLLVFFFLEERKEIRKRREVGLDREKIN